MQEAAAMTATMIGDLEYRAREDDAWYGVEVKLPEDGRTLEVMFPGHEAWNFRFTATEFNSIGELDELLDRFRPVSEQLQDNECNKVIKGITVCAALSSRSDDLRFYDAVVEDVQHQRHLITDGEEECLCSFMLCWLHGPMLANISIVKLADICTIQAAVLANPRITSFAKLTKDKILAERRLQDTEVESYCFRRRKERLSLSFDKSGDEDLGGSDLNFGSGCFVLIGNLEKDLSTSSMKQFIFEHTHVSVRAYLFPSKSSVPYCSGAIVSDSKANIDRIYDFLVHPEHLIVSERERPWVVFEKVLDGIGGTSGATLGGSIENFVLPRYEDLKVVHSGTEAYNTAKQMQDLFVELMNHKKLLYKRFGLEEKEILKSSQLGRPLHIR